MGRDWVNFLSKGSLEWEETQPTALFPWSEAKPTELGLTKSAQGT